MQPWQIKALELEASALNRLDGFIHEHALYFFIGAIYLLLALLAWVLSGGIATERWEIHAHVRPASSFICRDSHHRHRHIRPIPRISGPRIG